MLKVTCEDDDHTIRFERAVNGWIVEDSSGRINDKPAKILYIDSCDPFFTSGRWEVRIVELPSERVAAPKEKNDGA